MSAFMPGATTWPAVSSLLDEALALPPAARATWLADLPPEHAPIRGTLARLLEVQAGIENGTFLATMPGLACLAYDAAPRAADGPAGSAAQDPPDAGPADRVGPWRLLRALGSGGMGSVWLAERADGALRRQVALKLPRLSWAPDLAARMARERDILASLEHPHIARLYDAGVDAMGRPWLALEFVEGEHIDAHCRARRLPVRDRVGLLLQVCAAVAHAHGRLLIHRDLKPSNVLVTAAGEVRLLDFGVAKLLQDDPAGATVHTEFAGQPLTPGYASPEQLRGERLTTASDVYSLGVLAYELLAGARPYRLARGDADALAAALAASDPPPASSAATDPVAAQALRGDLDAVLAQALRKQPADRYPTVLAFADDLRRWLADEAVLARREPRPERLLRAIRRHRWPLAAGAAVALSLVTGTAVALWQAEVARREARTSQAVQRFLEGILGASDPNQPDPARARDRTARELLELGARRIEEELAEDPLAQARVMRMLADIYSAMGEMGESLRLNALRASLLARVQGEGTPDHLLASAELAISESRLGQTDAARRTFQVVERGLAAMKGRDDPQLRAALLTRVAIFFDTSDPARALQAAREAASLLEPFGPSEELEGAWRKAGIAAFHAQAFDEARLALRRARDLAQAHGGMPAALAETLVHIGHTETALGQADEARSALLEAVRLTETAIAGDGRQAALAKVALGDFHLARGELAESVDLFARARAALTRLPVDRRGTDALASIVTFESGALHQFGRLDDALARIDEGLADDPRYPVPAHHRVGLLNQRALVRITAGDAAAAERALVQAEALIAAEALQDHPLAAAVRLARSRWLLLQGRPAEARSLLEQAVRQLDGAPLAQASHPADLTLAARIDLARQQWESAAGWAEAALARTPGGGQDPSFHGALAWQALGLARLGAGHTEAAVPALQRAVDQLERRVDRERSPQLAAARADLARALRAAGPGR